MELTSGCERETSNRAAACQPLDGAEQVETQRRVRVMVVEDHADAAQAYAGLLKCWGFDVDVATDGRAALDQASRFLADVFLIDLAVPKIDGVSLVRLLRKEPLAHDCLMIAITGYVDEDLRRQALDAGFDDYLVKPVPPEILHGTLDARARTIARSTRR